MMAASDPIALDASGVPDASPGVTGRRRWIRRLAVALVWITVLVAWRRYQTANDLTATGSAQAIVDDVRAVWWGVFAFVAIYLARPIVLFPASVLTVAAGVLYGPIVGIAVVVVAANASAMVAFGVGRALGAPPGERGPAASPIAGWTDRMRSNSFETVLVMRLVFLPYDFVNYAAGALHVRARPFLLATAIGSLPGTVSFVLLGASLERVDEGIGGIDGVALVAGLAILVASLTLARLLKRRRRTEQR